MFNVKWGLFAGGAACALAFVTSLLMGQVPLLIALLRALCFAAVFFGIGFGVRILISAFIPELLFAGSPEKKDNDIVENVFKTETPGSQIDVTVDDLPIPTVDTSGAALPDTESNAQGAVEVGDITDLIAGKTKDVDQDDTNGYNNDEGFAPDGPGDMPLDFSAFTAGTGAVSGKSSESEAEKNLPMGETDSMMDVFALFSDDSDFKEDESVFVPERKVSSNKPEKLEGDFNAKELAAGIRTVLEKGKRG